MELLLVRVEGGAPTLLLVLGGVQSGALEASLEGIWIVAPIDRGSPGSLEDAADGQGRVRREVDVFAGPTSRNLTAGTAGRHPRWRSSRRPRGCGLRRDVTPDLLDVESSDEGLGAKPGLGRGEVIVGEELPFQELRFLRLRLRLRSSVHRLRPGSLSRHEIEGFVFWLLLHWWVFAEVELGWQESDEAHIHPMGPGAGRSLLQSLFVQDFTSLNWGRDIFDCGLVEMDWA